MERFLESGAAQPDCHTNKQTGFKQNDINRIDVTYYYWSLNQTLE
jgi:hypothetical protein